MAKPRTISGGRAHRVLVVSIHTDPVAIHAAVLDLRDRSDADLSAPAFVVGVPTPRSGRSSALQRLVDNSGFPADRGSGVGIAVSGPLTDGVIVDPPNQPGWHRINRAKELGERLGWLTCLDSHDHSTPTSAVAMALDTFLEW